MPEHKSALEVIKTTLEEKRVDFGYMCSVLGIRKNKFLDCLDGKSELKSSEFLSVCMFLDLRIKDFINNKG